MAVYVSDLPERGQVDGRKVFLYCPRCGARNSADRADYFMADPDTKFRCGNHRPLVDMRLVYEVRELVEVERP